MPCNYPRHGWVKPSGGITFTLAEGLGHARIQVPCGSCIGCRIDKSVMWASRISHEASLYDNSIFATLTYDEKNLPENETLVKEHVQEFIKKLRKKIGYKKIRYYAVGEYGEDNKRPHYHIIIFNFKPADERYLKKSQTGENLYHSESLSTIWGKGWVNYGACTFDSAQYCAKYCCTVFKNSNEELVKSHYGLRLPEFALMSKRPGIGKEFILKTNIKNEVLNTGVISVDSVDLPIPRYYINILLTDEKNHDKILQIKHKSKSRALARALDDIGQDRREFVLEHNLQLFKRNGG